MSRMTALAPLLSAIVWVGGSDNAVAERKSDPSQLKVGSHCELQTKVSKDGRSWTIYLGTVKEIDETFVTLHDTTVTVHNDKSTPILRGIPLLKTFFRNVGVGRSHIGGKTVVIPLKDIAWNEAVTAEEFRMRSAIPTKNADHE